MWNTDVTIKYGLSLKVQIQRRVFDKDEGAFKPDLHFEILF